MDAKFLPFTFNQDDLQSDPLSRVARPGRTELALKMAETGHKVGLDSFRNPDAKAASLIGWVSALMAITAFQNIGRNIPFSLVTVAAFLCLFLALLLAILVHHPSEVLDAGILYPLDIYDYTEQDAWDYRAGDEYSANDIAKAQSELRMVQLLDAAIRRLDVATEGKLKLLSHAYKLYGVGILLLSLSFALSAHWIRFHH